MLGNLGLHIIKNPAGTYSFVGSIPANLGEFVPATTMDVMAGRAFKRDGKILTIKFPVFPTREAAATYACVHGCEVIND